jgi:hypothetical protein
MMVHGRRLNPPATAVLVAAVVLSALAPAARSFGAPAAPSGSDGAVVFDFETGDLQGWRVVEGEFGLLVSPPRDVRNHQGRWILTTLQRQVEANKTDRMTGVLESPVLVLRAPEVTFRVGGGKHASTYVALCGLDGKEHLRAGGASSVVMREVRWRAPHLVGKPVFLRVVDRHTGGWGHVTFDDFRARGKVDEAATAERFAALDRARRDAARRHVLDRLASVRRAVRDLSETFGERYPDGRAYLARLEAIKRTVEAATPEALEARVEDIQKLARAALLASPLVRDHPILFVVRHQYRGDHHNTATMFQNGEINAGKFQGPGAVKLLHLDGGERVETLLELPGGVARDPDVHFDGQRVLLSIRRDPKDDYSIYELDLRAGTAAQEDGRTGDLPGVSVFRGRLRALTALDGVTDIDPCYLPDGRIIFASTREPKFCMCNRHIMGNLFRMDCDGANVHQVGHSTLHEGHPALMPDGSVLYDRWEYVDRNFGDAQGVWLCRPDGTNHALLWGNNTKSPGGVIDARPIPGTERFVATFTSCHDRPWGALAVVDRSRGMDGKAPVVRTWPADAIDHVMIGNYDRFKQVKPKYEDPYPLHDPQAPDSAGKYFLCSRQTGDGEATGIYLVDVFGNEVLVHAEAPGCFDPMPLAPWLSPPVVPDRTDLREPHGTFYVHDVYIGTGMEVVERGTVKYLRVVESPEKRFWTGSNWQGSGTQAPGMNWDDFNNKRILGTVPVEADGSAYFTVPADRFVYFQLLDENRMMVQSMRSGTIVRPGERLGCVGCHEDRRTAVPNVTKAAAAGAPSTPEPPFGREPFLFNYLAEIQPIWDRHCVRCHDFGGKAAGTFLLAGDITRSFNVSYMELRRKGLVKVIGAGPAPVQKPYSWGSHASKLVQHLRQSVTGKRLNAEEFERIVTWIDINAPYYPSYASAYRKNLYGRCPIDTDALKRLKALTGVDVLRRPHDPLISFTRPEVSPCLAELKAQGGEAYDEALAIIRRGKQALAERPRMDMPGGELRGPDREREEKYVRLLRRETEARRAIADGRRLRDDEPLEE